MSDWFALCVAASHLDDVVHLVSIKKTRSSVMPRVHWVSSSEQCGVTMTDKWSVITWYTRQDISVNYACLFFCRQMSQNPREKKNIVAFINISQSKYTTLQGRPQLTQDFKDLRLSHQMMNLTMKTPHHWPFKQHVSCAALGGNVCEGSATWEGSGWRCLLYPADLNL